MSSVASQAAGGSSPNEQSGTASAVSNGLHPVASTHNASIQNATTLSFPQTPITQSVASNEIDSDNDSLFGDDDGISFGDVWAGHSMDGANDLSPANEKALSHDEQPGSDRLMKQVAAAHLTFPAVKPNNDNGASTQVNAALPIATTAHEEFPNNNIIGNAAAPVNAPTTAANVIDHETTSELASSLMTDELTNNSNTAPSNMSTANPDQVDVFGALSHGSVPKANVSSAVLFGPDLQKALFTDGEASSDPQLPGSGNQIHAPSDPMLQATSGNVVQLGQAASIAAHGEIIEPSNPQRPPATHPRLLDIPISQPSASAPYEAMGAHAYSANPNPSPDKPETPQADQLRADFWNWYRKGQQSLLAYRQSYKAWLEFTTNESNKAKTDYEQTAETLKTQAIAAQVAWAKFSRDFDKWKTDSPAVAPIIANIHDEMKLIRAGEKLKAERADLVRELRGKPQKEQKAEIARYDDFLGLLRQSRVRELWRGRVEAQKSAQAMIEAGLQTALAEEQERIAAEERKKKAEVEAAERARLEVMRLELLKLEKEKAEKERAERERAEKERLEQEKLEQQRREAEATEKQRIANEAAENARRAAEAQAQAQAAEQERLAAEAEARGRAQREDMDQGISAQAAFNNADTGAGQGFQF